MRALRAICSLVPLVAVLSLGLPANVGAEGSADPSPSQNPAEAANALADQIDHALRESAELFDKTDAAEGEDRELLADSALRRVELVLRTLPKLVTAVVNMRDDGVDDAGAGVRAAGQVDWILGSMQRRMPRRQKHLADLKARRQAASVDDAIKLDREIRARERWFDDSLKMFAGMVDLKRQLGRDNTADLARLQHELTVHAEIRASQLRITARQLAETRAEAASYDGDREVVAREAEVPLKRKLDDITVSLTKVIDLMEDLDLETAEYRRLLVKTTGQVTGRILDPAVFLGLLDDWLGSLSDWFSDNGPAIGFKIILFLAILFLFRLIAGFTRRVVERALSGPKVRLSRLLRDFILMTAYRGVWVVGILVALSQLGIEVGPLLTGLGVAGFIVGFALQNTLSNFASGLMILAYRPFDVGDFIEAAGVSGVAQQLNLVSTTVLTFDNRRLVVPNTKIWEDVIVNVTAEKLRRVDLIFGIGYGDDIEHAERVLHDIVSEHAKILDEPKPIIKVHTLNESSVDFVVRPWVHTKDYWDVYWDVTREVKRRFDAEGISIPFPQRDLHVIEAPDVEQSTTVGDPVGTTADEPAPSDDGAEADGDDGPGNSA